MSSVPTAPRQNLGDFVSEVVKGGFNFLSNVMTPPGAQTSRQESSSEKNKANNAFNNVAGKKAKKKHTKKKTGSFFTRAQFRGRSQPLSERTKQRMARTDKKRKAQGSEDGVVEEEEEEISDFEEEESPKRKVTKKKKKKRRPNEDMSMDVMDISRDGEDDEDLLTSLKSDISDKRKQGAEEKKQKQRAQVLRAAEQRQHSGQSALTSVGKERKQPYTKKLGGKPGRHQPTVRTPTLVTKRRTSQPIESEFFFII